MAERERRLTPPRGGVFVPRTKVLSAEDVQRALRRVAHEIVERNRGLEDVVVVGLQTGGVPLAERDRGGPARDRGDRECPVGTLDVAFYRDDVGIRPVLPEAATAMPGDLTGSDRRARRRRALHRSDGAGRARRARRLRPGASACSWR